MSPDLHSWNKSLQHAGRLLSLQLYSISPVYKNGTILWFDFSCSYEVRVLSVCLQYSRIENPVALQKWLYSRVSTAIRDLSGLWEAANQQSRQLSYLRTQLSSLWSVSEHCSSGCQVSGCRHVVYFSDHVISKISSSSYQQLNIDTKTSCFVLK